MIVNDVLYAIGCIIYTLIGLYFIFPIAITLAICNQIKLSLLLICLEVIVILVWVHIGYMVYGD